MSIELNNICFFYGAKTPYQVTALENVNLKIDKGNFLGIVGHTGSGKSTLVQHLNGLLNPTFGSFKYSEEGQEIYSINREPKLDKKGRFIYYKDKKNPKLKDLRKHIGLVFQFPEYQLFETDVLTDVMYGPKNFGMSESEARQAAVDALKMVGINESYFTRSPFELSGGEKRKIAIAGIIASKPKYLVLDEPTAGLDPMAEYNMLRLFREIGRNGTTIVLITHNMDIVLKFCDRLIVVDNAKIVQDGEPLKIFQDSEFINSSSLEAPYVLKVCNELIKNGLALDIKNVKDIKSLAREIKRVKSL